ncbi:MAG: NEL-type E3 ubiquitin ligase domain-containing protein [Candidatus Endonucleobacter bathymodioli]|uniref:NEL-type E3 ubiquitin ligase domain-containing protein n=1 Tax=Candidatus Endonucleibacter bathymodioli TaxID=539814 RepID=A0AA90NWD6_9GAMM|nr:NEL-type E3 ubiquitin ligase domain-containing protein [Candidatus Endonucleobacter bathymodioli]
MYTKLYFRKNLILPLITATIIFNTGTSLAVTGGNSDVNQEKHRGIPGDIKRPRSMDPDLATSLIPPEPKKMRKDPQENTSTDSNSITKADTQPDQKIEAGAISNCDEETVLPIQEIEASALKQLIFEKTFCNKIHYKILGDFMFNEEPLLVMFPDNLTVTGMLKIRCCCNLKTLPKKLHAESVEINDCNDFTTMSENLHIKHLTLINCNGLILLPATLKVYDTAKISYCPQLTHVPKDFVKINLTVEYCGEIKNLGYDLKLTGHLHVCECPKLTTIAVNDLVVESFFIIDNTMLKRVARRIDAKGGVHNYKSSISFCDNLTTLAKNSEFYSEFEIAYCQRLTTLSALFRVHRNFSISFCDNITKLGYGFRLLKNVYITTLSNMTKIGDNIHIGGVLYLKDIPNMKELGNSITADSIKATECPCLSDLGCIEFIPSDDLRRLSEDQSNLILKEYNSPANDSHMITTQGVKCKYRPPSDIPYSNRTIRELSNTEVQGMEFVSYHHVSEKVVLSSTPRLRFKTFAEAFTFWQKLASPNLTSDADIPTPELEINVTNVLIEFLYRLTTTTDYANKNLRTLLAEQVIKTMPFFIQKNEYQDFFLDILSSYMDDLYCSIDGITFELSQLEMVLSLKDAEIQAIKNNDSSLLKQVTMEEGMKMMILKEVEEISADYIARKCSNHDPIVVRLAFQISLQEEFNLPSISHSKHFVDLSGVEQKDIHQAIARINNVCTDVELDAFLTTWAPWEKYLSLVPQI